MSLLQSYIHICRSLLQSQIHICRSLLQRVRFIFVGLFCRVRFIFVGLFCRVRFIFVGLFCTRMTHPKDNCLFKYTDLDSVSLAECVQVSDRHFPFPMRLKSSSLFISVFDSVRRSILKREVGAGFEYHFQEI